MTIINTELPNRYKLTRIIRQELANLYEINLPNMSDRKIRIFAHEHIADRLIDRNILLDQILYICKQLYKFHIDDLFKLFETEENGNRRINCYGKSNDMIGITLSYSTEEQTLFVNIRTCYLERNYNNRKRIITTKHLFCKGHENHEGIV